MQIVDANLLLYSINSRDPHHEAARSWLERALNAGEAIGFAWVVMLAFLRVATSRRAFPAPLEVDEALACLEAWLSRPASVIVQPTVGHLVVLSSLVRQAGTAANLVNDAHLAALSIEHGAAIASFDHDFHRFRGVRLTVP